LDKIVRKVGEWQKRWNEMKSDGRVRFKVMESERKRGGAGRLHLSAVSAEAEERASHVVLTHPDHVT
jgi:hypothetical protein